MRSLTTLLSLAALTAAVPVVYVVGRDGAVMYKEVGYGKYSPYANYGSYADVVSRSHNAEGQEYTEHVFDDERHAPTPMTRVKRQDYGSYKPYASYGAYYGGYDHYHNVGDAEAHRRRDMMMENKVGNEGTMDNVMRNTKMCRTRLRELQAVRQLRSLNVGEAQRERDMMIEGKTDDVDSLILKDEMARKKRQDFGSYKPYASYGAYYGSHGEYKNVGEGTEGKTEETEKRDVMGKGKMEEHMEKEVVDESIRKRDMMMKDKMEEQMKDERMMDDMLRKRDTVMESEKDVVMNDMMDDMIKRAEQNNALPHIWYRHYRVVLLLTALNRPYTEYGKYDDSAM
ncbi:hypothetical protein K469DRAFT_754085 [Zopfia rhizophila CBS 207.26]|uniref:Uncharacterized protein n=1 Tax=Zopfia rhizophila CBS 207.26 TaxID=1314779 RepID=A0A6A6DJ91_9PEZI|nr:hypothetical protein K469DRAFT_754085 [Zopfia rhizophila CBS 207.26]